MEWDADDGPTDYDNGMQLCGTHHRFVHEGGWKVRGNPDEALVFIRPDGKEFTGAPPVIEASSRATLFDMATRTAERVVVEREQMEVQREADRQRREREYAKQREADRLRREDLQRYQYPDNVDWDGWGKPA